MTTEGALQVLDPASPLSLQLTDPLVTLRHTVIFSENRITVPCIVLQCLDVGIQRLDRLDHGTHHRSLYVCHHASFTHHSM
jgi:hypothetical protein